MHISTNYVELMTRQPSNFFQSKYDIFFPVCMEYIVINAEGQLLET